MELYLDSVDFKEVREAVKLGFLEGITTTPTFMHRHGIKDVDKAIVDLSHMARHVHVEALRVQKNGGDHEEDQQQKNAVHQGCQVGLSLIADRIRMSLQVTWHDETQLASSSD